MTNLREKALGYLRTNWGAPFVLAFIVLLIASAALLGAGRSSTANSIAVYAFYALVLGVVLQIASYIRYGESEQKEPTSYIPSSTAPPRSFRPGKRTLAVVVLIIVIAAGIGSAIYYVQLSNSHTSHTTTTSTSRIIGPLSLGIGFIKELPLPQNGVQIILGVNQTGGIQPYNFSVYWSDGTNQSNDIGIFIRTFFSNQSIPGTAEIFVKSSDGQSATVLAQIPSVNRTTTTTSLTTSIPTVTFIESGLKRGAHWSVTLPETVYRSNTSQIVFSYFAGKPFSYVISGPYDTKNFAWAFIPSPQSGTINVNNTDIQISVAFSNKSVFTPPNQLFIMTSPPTALSSGAGIEQLSVTYLNTFPDQVEGIVFATVRNSGTGSISVQTATISPLASSLQTINLVFNGLKSGNYSASIFVESSDGILLSGTTNSTFAITG
ncbi:MAG: hypothetical protein ACYCPW_08120 [Nitrososphaerales archaeon]